MALSNLIIISTEIVPKGTRPETALASNQKERLEIKTKIILGIIEKFI